MHNIFRALLNNLILANRWGQLRALNVNSNYSATDH